MLRAVLDANVLVSALLSLQGTPAQVLSAWEAGAFELIVSPAILEELDRVLHYPKLQARYRLPEDRIQTLLHLLRNQAAMASPADLPGAVERDPGDDCYLECAVGGGAQVIVSGDRHLLQIGRYADVQILAPAGFMTLLNLERRVS